MLTRIIIKLVNLKILLINLKNIVPYIILILIYFIFMNIEAKKLNNIDYLNKKIEKNTNNSEHATNVRKASLRIKIPVIPYDQ